MDKNIIGNCSAAATNPSGFHGIVDRRHRDRVPRLRRLAGAVDPARPWRDLRLGCRRPGASAEALGAAAPCVAYTDKRHEAALQ